MPVRGKYSPERSASNLAKAFFIRPSISSLCSLVMPGLRPNPSMLRPTLILVDFTGTSSSMLPLILEASMSLVCVESAEMPWYSWMMGSNTLAKSL